MLMLRFPPSSRTPPPPLHDPTTQHDKTLGGSSALNVMLVHRGTASDYQKWEQQGAEGWGPDEVLKYFKKSEVRGMWERRVVCRAFLFLLLACSLLHRPFGPPLACVCVSVSQPYARAVPVDPPSRDPPCSFIHSHTRHHRQPTGTTGQPGRRRQRLPRRRGQLPRGRGAVPEPLVAALPRGLPAVRHGAERRLQRLVPPPGAWVRPFPFTLDVVSAKCLCSSCVVSSSTFGP
jgi:choline dehydrogenase-like flavoprotein